MKPTDKDLRDIVALSTVPALWLGAEAVRVAESLAAALYATSEADLVFVALRVGDLETPTVVQTGRHATRPDVAESLSAELLEAAMSRDSDELVMLPDPLEEGRPLHLAFRPLGPEARYGLIAAGCHDARRAGSAQRHLLLNVAATQAAVAVQNIQLFRSVQTHANRLETSEERERLANRDLQTLQDVSQSLAGELDMEKLLQRVTDAARVLTGAEFAAFFFNVNEPGAERYSLYTLSGAPRAAFEDFGPPRNSALFEPTFRGAGPVRADDVHQHKLYGRNPPHYGMPEGHLPVRSYLAVPVASRTGEVLGGLFFGHSAPGVFQDRAERMATGIAAHAAVAIDNASLFAQAQDEVERRRQAEETQQLLIAELNHRVKNTLAIVQAISNQTLRTASSPKSFAASFAGRLQSLAEAHLLLTRANWTGAELSELITRQLAGLDQNRISLEGPNVWVTSQVAVHLGMVLHELGTNAQKHGALSTETGGVDVEWRCDGELLRLTWSETGGKPCPDASSKGFGRNLIEQSLRAYGGSTQLHSRPEGVCWRITLRLPAKDGFKEPPPTTSPERPRAAHPDAVAGRSVLVVEDEPLLGWELVELLERLGVAVVGPAASVREAVALVRSERIDCALLDANLNGASVHDVAAALREDGTPFAFVTGYAREDLPEEFRNVRVLPKPLDHRQLRDALAHLLECDAAGEPSEHREDGGA